MNLSMFGAIVLCVMQANGSQGSFMVQPVQPAVCNGKMIFSANDQDRGNEPWVSDGTSAGTKCLKDIWPGPRPSNPSDFMAIGKQVLFWAQDSVHGRELWTTDGTPAGTQLLMEIVPGRGGSSPWGRHQRESGACRHVIFKGMLYFFATDEDGWGSVLYKTDGTAEGTVRIVSAKSNPGEMLVGQDCVYIFNYAGGLWRTDGTPAEGVLIPTGTRLISEVKKWERDSLSKLASPDREASWRPVCIRRTAFFAAVSEDHGIELWKTDGTEEGTRMVRDIRKGYGAGYDKSDRDSYPQWLTVFNDRVFFAATDDVNTNRGRELWKSDGTEEGTVMVKDIMPGRDSSSPKQLIVWNNKLYFTVHGRPGKYSLPIWQTNGTEAGTRPAPIAQGNNWPLTWATSFKKNLYCASAYRGNIAIIMWKPGESQRKMLWYSKRGAYQYHYPFWVPMGDRLFFISEGKLWDCAKLGR